MTDTPNQSTRLRFRLSEPGKALEPYAEFATLELATLFVASICREPVKLYDATERRRGTLYPSGQVDWNPPARR